MPSWSEILEKVNEAEAVNPSSGFPYLINCMKGSIRRASELTNRNTILYFSSFLHKPQPADGFFRSLPDSRRIPDSGQQNRRSGKPAAGIPVHPLLKIHPEAFSRPPGERQSTFLQKPAARPFLPQKKKRFPQHGMRRTFLPEKPERDRRCCRPGFRVQQQKKSRCRNPGTKGKQRNTKTGGTPAAKHPPAVRLHRRKKAYPKMRAGQARLQAPQKEPQTSFLSIPCAAHQLDLFFKISPNGV